MRRSYDNAGRWLESTTLGSLAAPTISPSMRLSSSAATWPSTWRCPRSSDRHCQAAGPEDKPPRPLSCPRAARAQSHSMRAANSGPPLAVQLLIGFRPSTNDAPNGTRSAPALWHFRRSRQPQLPRASSSGRTAPSRSAFDHRPSRSTECKSSALSRAARDRPQLFDIRTSTDGFTAADPRDAYSALCAARLARRSPDESCAPQLKQQQQHGEDESVSAHARW